MFCKFCGAEIDDNTAICVSCGRVVNGNMLYKKRNVIAILGFVFSFFISVIGFILSVIGCIEAKKCNGEGMALSIGGIFVSVVWWLLIVAILLTRYC